jgi:outer membrane receptor protein involved in Fe transport
MKNRVSRTPNVPLLPVSRMCGVGLMMLWAGASHADDAAAPDAAEGGGLDEVTVSATRRNTTVQTTPLAISAVSAESLTNSGISNMQDVTALVPTMRIEGGRDGGGRITMRGIRAPAGESTVGLYYGEVPMTGPSDTTQSAGNFTQSANLFDVERIEALRGPQGTLYGASSMGGAMRVLFNKADTKKTSGVVDVNASSVVHGDPGYWAKGAYNMPLIEDKFAVRVALWQESRGGYVDDINTRRGVTVPNSVVDVHRTDYNTSSNHGGRLMSTFTPTDDLKWYVTVMRQQSESVASNWYESLGEDSYFMNDGVIGEIRDDLKLYSSELQYHYGPVDATWVSSYYKWDRVAVSDYTPVLTRSRLSTSLCGRWWNETGRGAPITPVNGVANCSAVQLPSFTAYSDALSPAALEKPNRLQNAVNEFRIASSDADAMFSYLFGAYFEKRKDHVDSQTGTITTSNGRVENLDAFPVFWHREIADDIKQTAYFGDLTYKPKFGFAPGLSLNYGIRKFDYQKITSGQGDMNGYATGDYIRPFAVAKVDGDGWLQKYNISYEFEQPFMVYATMAKGYRPGGANQTPNLEASLVPYQADSVWNYEIGGKSTWLNNRLTVNLTAYKIDWDNIQISASTANRCCSFITNAGKAEIQGAEFEVTARPLYDVEVNLGVSYNLKAELTEDQLNSRIADSLQLGLKGNPIPFVAKLNGAMNVQYRHALVGDAMGLVRVNYSYTGKSHTQFRHDYNNDDEIGGFSQVNLRAGVEVNSWAAYLFVNNVLDSVGVFEANSNVPYVENRVLTQTPREIGLNIRKTF